MLPFACESFGSFPTFTYNSSSFLSKATLVVRRHRPKLYWLGSDPLPHSFGANEATICSARIAAEQHGGSSSPLLDAKIGATESRTNNIARGATDPPISALTRRPAFAKASSFAQLRRDKPAWLAD